MKNLITIIIVFMSMTSFGQDIKFDIYRNMDNEPMFVPKTKVVDINKLDTAYIHVYTNDTSAIQIMKNTYLMDHYTVGDGNVYKFYFPKKSSARIMTNLEGGNIKYVVNMYIEEENK